MRLCILGFSLVFTAYLSNAVVSGKLPFWFSGSQRRRCYRLRLVACSARISVDTHTQTDKPTTVTLSVHACRGLISVVLRLMAETTSHRPVISRHFQPLWTTLEHTSQQSRQLLKAQTVLSRFHPGAGSVGSVLKQCVTTTRLLSSF